MVDSNSLLTDRFGRRHRNLRVSVTDRCNIRCFYCMPATDVVFQPRAELLTFEEIQRLVSLFTTHGVNRIRITGGEPLVRQDLPALIRMLSQDEQLVDLALTTNGMLLEQFAGPLRAAGLERLNISLDTLSEATFEKITRRSGLTKVLQGIDAAIDAGFPRIRLNALSIAGLTEHEILPLVDFARSRDLEMRFIEFMPLDADQTWTEQRVLTGQEVRAMIEDHFGPLTPAARPDPSQPAVDFELPDGKGRIGLINPVSQPFCDQCDRLRLTADGKIRNCLFSTEEWSLRDLMRAGSSDEILLKRIAEAVAAKKAGQGTDNAGFHRPERAMYQIGG